MSETNNTKNNETLSGSSADFSEHVTVDIQYEIIRLLIISNNINPFDHIAIAKLLNKFEGKFDEDVMLKAVKDAQTKAMRDARDAHTKKVDALRKQFGEMRTDTNLCSKRPF